MDYDFLERKFKLIHSTSEDINCVCVKCGKDEPFVRGILNGKTSLCIYNYPDLKARQANICRDCHIKNLKSKRQSTRSTSIFIKNCSICSSIIVSKYKKTQYCSKVCTNKVRNTREYTSYDLTCERCDNKFTNNRKTKYCSVKCRRKKDPVALSERECKKCGKEFMGKGPAKYCSNDCSPWRKSDSPLEVKCNSCEDRVIHPKRKCESCKNKPKPEKVVYTKTCQTCSSEFKTTNKQKIYCKSGHSVSSKESNKLRKRTERKCKLSVESWNDISEFKKDRHEGYELDHIVPLNHPDVCGLHNTWNFQWLPKEDNNTKSNKFDGTEKNSSWEIFLKQ